MSFLITALYMLRGVLPYYISGAWAVQDSHFRIRARADLWHWTQGPGLSPKGSNLITLGIYENMKLPLGKAIIASTVQ